MGDDWHLELLPSIVDPLVAWSDATPPLCFLLLRICHSQRRISICTILSFSFFKFGFCIFFLFFKIYFYFYDVLKHSVP